MIDSFPMNWAPPSTSDSYFYLSDCQQKINYANFCIRNDKRTHTKIGDIFKSMALSNRLSKRNHTNFVTIKHYTPIEGQQRFIK